MNEQDLQHVKNSTFYSPDNKHPHSILNKNLQL